MCEEILIAKFISKILCKFSKFSSLLYFMRKTYAVKDLLLKLIILLNISNLISPTGHEQFGTTSIWKPIQGRFKAGVFDINLLEYPKLSALRLHQKKTLKITFNFRRLWSTARTTHTHILLCSFILISFFFKITQKRNFLLGNEDDYTEN